MIPSPLVVKDLLQFLEHTIESEAEVLHTMLDEREPWQKIFDQFRRIEQFYDYEAYLNSLPHSEGE